MAANNTAIMAVMMLVIGAKLVGDGIAGFEHQRAITPTISAHDEQRR